MSQKSIPPTAKAPAERVVRGKRFGYRWLGRP
jgi:hypothetical protein